MIPLKDENPTATFPFVTILFIVINTVVFAYERWVLGPEHVVPFITRMAVIPAEITTGFAVHEYPTFVTSLFLHGGWLHLLGNMLYLWIFGNNIEDAFGHIPFVLFYLLCGIVASLTHIVFNAASTVPTIGASGAISGVLGAYLILYPRARVLTVIPIFPIFFFIRPIRVPAAFLLVFWIIFQLVYALPSLKVGTEAAHEVAWFAHIGGFAAGIVFLPLFLRRGQARRMREI